MWGWAWGRGRRWGFGDGREWGEEGDSADEKRLGGGDRRIVISSAQFQGKPQIARHRAVNALLKEELEREGGIHALQMRTLTLEEEDRLLEKAREIEKAEAEGKCAGACAKGEEKA